MIYPLLSFVGKRLVNSGVLVLSTALGLLITVTFVTAIPLYSEGLSAFLLKLELGKPDSQRTQPRGSVLLHNINIKILTEIPLRRLNFRN